MGKSWLEQWLSVTSSWVDPVATLGAGTVTALLPDVVLTVLTDGILSRFLGQQIDLTVHGHRVRGVLKLLAVRRTGAVFKGELELVDIDWDGYRIEELRSVAHGVRLIPGVPTRIDAEHIDVEGRVTVASLVEWLNSRGLDWELEALESGLVRATNRDRRFVATCDASVRDDHVRIVVYGAKWFGVPVPGNVIPNRHVQLTPLPNDTRIVRAVRDGREIRFLLDMPAVSGAIDLAQIRDAILAGTALILW